MDLDLLQTNSIMLLGERHPNKVVWVQVYDSSQKIEEDDLRKLILEISNHISNSTENQSSPLEFLGGKLLYIEINRTPSEITRNKIICLYTKDNMVGDEVYKAIEQVGYRGGIFSIYSAKRFFTELVDLLQDPEKLDQEIIKLEYAVKKLEEIEGKQMSKNELGQLISLINRSLDMDHDTIEKLYFLVYEGVESITVENGKMEDLDEFLDASYIIAQKYSVSDNFYLALELFKKIIPIARKNNRYDLETICSIQIGTIYKRYFPSPGDYILTSFEEVVSEEHLRETSKPNLEKYYCLKGFAYENLKKYEKAKQEYEKAIQELHPIVGSPQWIADAYRFLGEHSERNMLYSNAIRFYLTSAAICFGDGDVSNADHYRDLAGKVELKMGIALSYSAIVSHNDSNRVDAEYRVWEALRSLIKTYLHVSPQNYFSLENQTNLIISIVKSILKQLDTNSQYKNLLRKIANGLEEIRLLESKTNAEIETLEDFNKAINDHLPLPPPTFILLTLDGRMITTGQIDGNEWKPTKFKGALLSGVLSAIMSLISEVAGQKSLLKTVDTGTFQIMLEQTENLAVVLLVDRDLPIFRKYLIEAMNEIDNEYGKTVKYWNGYHDTVMIENISEIVLDVFTQ